MTLSTPSDFLERMILESVSRIIYSLSAAPKYNSCPSEGKKLYSAVKYSPVSPRTYLPSSFFKLFPSLASAVGEAGTITGRCVVPFDVRTLPLDKYLSTLYLRAGPFPTRL